MVFIIGLLGIIAVGLDPPAWPRTPPTGRSLLPTHGLQTVGVLLVLKAFSAGCSALTGVEAIANGVPLFKSRRARRRAKRTELLLGVILGAMLLGLAVLARRWHIGPRSGQTVLSQIMAIAVGRHWAYYVVSLTITLVLALAANTSFGGLAGPREPARARQLPSAPVRAARRPTGLRQRHLGAGHPLGRLLCRGRWKHERADSAVRDRGLHRLHARPERASSSTGGATRPLGGATAPRSTGSARW